MTKKHFRAIAEVLSQLGERARALHLTGLHEYTVNEMANALQKYNKLFDRQKFLQACRVADEDLGEEDLPTESMSVRVE